MKYNPSIDIGILLTVAALYRIEFVFTNVSSFPIDTSTPLRSSTTTNTNRMPSVSSKQLPGRMIHTISKNNNNKYIPPPNRKSSSSMINMTPFYGSTNIFIGTNLLGWFISILRPQLHTHVDLLGTGAFALSGLYILLNNLYSNNASIQVLFSSLAVILWSCRLALFLFYRVIQLGHDQRLTSILSNPSSAFGFWFISALWGIICSLPHTMGTIPTKLATGSTVTTPVTPISMYIGIITFLLGFGVEVTADAQKWFFKQQQQEQSANFCNVGLWSISQHPNWFGNLLLWIGIFIINSSTFIDPPAMISNHHATTALKKFTSTIYQYRRFGIAMIGPIFMYVLFYSQATGIILNDTLQANMAKYGYGRNVQYTKYIDQTPFIVPNIRKLILQWTK